jgi:CheY-like chemotaxis protein
MPATNLRDFLTRGAAVARLNGAIRSALDRRSRRGALVGKILLVDDDPLIRRVLTVALESAGHEVVGARDGREALAIFDADPSFDLVLTDIQMPEVDGLTVIQQLKLRKVSPKIIAMTSAGPGAYLRAAKAFGADVAIAKPSDWKELLDAVRGLLGH